MSAPQRGISVEPLVDVGADRLGVDAAEVRVALGVQLANGQPAVADQPRVPAGAGPVQVLDEDAPLGGADLLDVDDAVELVPEARVGVEDLDEARVDGIGVIATRRQLVGRVLVHRGLDGGEHLRRGGAAGIGLDLEAVVRPWVVARGDDDAGARPELAGEEAADLGRHGLRRREAADVVRRQHLDAGACEMLGGEPPVVADDDAAVRGAGPLEVLGHPPRTAPDVVEGVVLGDGRAPAIRPELDRRHRSPMVARRRPARYPSEGDGSPYERMSPCVRGSRASRSPTPMR